MPPRRLPQRRRRPAPRCSRREQCASPAMRLHTSAGLTRRSRLPGAAARRRSPREPPWTRRARTWPRCTRLRRAAGRSRPWSAGCARATRCTRPAPTPWPHGRSSTLPTCFASSGATPRRWHRSTLRSRRSAPTPRSPGRCRTRAARSCWRSGGSATPRRRSQTLAGIPVDPRFDMAALGPASAGLRGGARPRVLLTGGGFGIGDIEATAAALLRTLRSADVTVVCGRNEALEAGMRALAASWPAGDGRGNSLEVLGYTKEMHRIMAGADVLVGKPGGLTTTEAKALGLPMVLLRPIPGQEERNAQVLVESGAAVRTRGPIDAAEAVARLLAEPSALRAMAGAAAANSRPLAAFDVARRVMAEAARRGSPRLPRLVGMSAA
ncbi:MAG: hypothetical protein FJ260_04440 [Planctomycetes bacterium]|nr:hypothetical protein [Planctomycetota bacterium]